MYPSLFTKTIDVEKTDLGGRDTSEILSRWRVEGLTRGTDLYGRCWVQRVIRVKSSHTKP